MKNLITREGEFLVRAVNVITPASTWVPKVGEAIEVSNYEAGPWDVRVFSARAGKYYRVFGARDYRFARQLPRTSYSPPEADQAAARAERKNSAAQALAVGSRSVVFKSGDGPAGNAHSHQSSRVVDRVPEPVSAEPFQAGDRVIVSFIAADRDLSSYDRISVPAIFVAFTKDVRANVDFAAYPFGAKALGDDCPKTWNTCRHPNPAELAEHWPESAAQPTSPRRAEETDERPSVCAADPPMIDGLPAVVWAGGKQPVPSSTSLRVLLRDGSKFTVEGWSLRWHCLGADSDILAYRLASPTPRPCEPLPAGHPHRALQALWVSDDSLQCWLLTVGKWAAVLPSWDAGLRYHVAHVAPVQP